MRLEELLQYDDIMIQCHDDPDADAIACGWTLLTYLESKGKTPRLVYTGERKVRKVNLLLMLDKFSIPLEYLPEPEGDPGASGDGGRPGGRGEYVAAALPESCGHRPSRGGG